MRDASRLGHGGGFWRRGLLALGLAFSSFACTTMDDGHQANAPGSGPEVSKAQSTKADGANGASGTSQDQDDWPIHHVPPQDGTHHLAH